MSIYHKHNHWNGVSIFRQTKDYIEGFGFTSCIHNNSAGNYFMKNNKMLIAFAQYWLDNNRNKLQLDAPKALASAIDGINFSNLDKVALDIKTEQDRVKNFLNQIQSKGWHFNTKTGRAYITPSELKCLHLLAKGNTGKQVANSLGISPRTVEGHINNIRSKLGFVCKSDMVKLYLEQVIAPE
jgi:DNA-binding CsgD family transcriptional regulator